MHININHANFKSKNENLFKKKLNKKIIYNIYLLKKNLVYEEYIFYLNKNF